jgi:hypothetical protein
MEWGEDCACIPKEQALQGSHSIERHFRQGGATRSITTPRVQKSCTMHSLIEQSRAFALLIRTSAWTPVAISYLGTNTHRRSDTKRV